MGEGGGQEKGEGFIMFFLILSPWGGGGGGSGGSKLPKFFVKAITCAMS